MACAGHPWKEIVWCDNNSTDGLREEIINSGITNVQILHNENLGVAPGYNRVMALASGSHIVITGCDMIMPDNWLKKMVEATQRVPNIGSISIYCRPPKELSERCRGPVQVINGVKVMPAMPIERRLLSRKLLSKIGYLREDFGLYGWEDVEWGHRAERVCKELGLGTYVLPGDVAEHLGTEGAVGYDHKDPSSYWHWKRKQVLDERKKQLMARLHEENFPFYSPF